jgi:hypothetical protein
MKKVALVTKPKAVFKSSQVSLKKSGTLQIDGIEFTNNLLQVNLRQVDRVFPYVLTCGPEMESLRFPDSQPPQSYCLDVIKEMTLSAVSHQLENHIVQQFKLDYLWQLSPGDSQAWPVADRKPLVAMLGNVQDRIGVNLLDSYILTPQYSSCGIFYYANTEFESCQVCPQEPCMGRRAPYNEELARKYSDRARKPCGSRN